MRTSRLSVLVGTPVLVAVAAATVLAGCGEAASVSTSTVINLESTNYFTIPPTPSTIATTTTLPGIPLPGQVTTDITLYKIVPNDTPSAVASRYGITLAQLDAVNVDTDGYTAFLVGITIKIPPGAVIPTTTIPQAEPGDKLCVEGTYTLESGDTPSGVAGKFDVSLDDLNRINAETPGYRNFIVGSEIKIPSNSTDC